MDMMNHRKTLAQVDMAIPEMLKSYATMLMYGNMDQVQKDIVGHDFERQTLKCKTTLAVTSLTFDVCLHQI